MSPIVLIFFIYWWNGISPSSYSYLFHLYVYIFHFTEIKEIGGKVIVILAILAIYTEVKFYPKPKWNPKLVWVHFGSHVNVLLAITVFVIFTGLRIMFVLKQPHLQHLFSIIYNEKLCAEWVSFWINFRKKTNVSFKSLLSLFPLSKALQNCVNIFSK